MMQRIVAIGLVGMALSDPAIGDDGLYIAPHEQEPDYSIEDGRIVMRIDSERLIITQLIFRFDTEDRSRFWLELDLNKLADPGDFYLFTIDGKQLQGFKSRGSGSNAEGCRWALAISDLEQGRALLRKIAKAYDLPAAQVLDQTKAEQSCVEWKDTISKDGRLVKFFQAPAPIPDETLHYRVKEGGKLFAIFLNRYGEVWDGSVVDALGGGAVRRFKSNSVENCLAAIQSEFKFVSEIEKIPGCALP